MVFWGVLVVGSRFRSFLPDYTCPNTRCAACSHTQHINLNIASGSENNSTPKTELEKRPKSKTEHNPPLHV
jgi:hypothetical protein